MARTRGAKDKRKRKRKRRSAQLLKPNQSSQTSQKLRNLELATRSVGNLSRGVNAITGAVEQGRITAKYLGYIPNKVAKSQRAKENLSLLNSGTRAGLNLLRLRTGILNW